MMQSMQGPSFGTVMSVIEEDARPMCENDIPSKKDAKKTHKCGSRMVKTVMFPTEDTAPQWACPACTVHLIDLHHQLSTEHSERVWRAVQRDPSDPFWHWTPELIRDVAAKHGFGANTHGPRRTVVAYHCEVWCDDGYACIRATNHSTMGVSEAIHESDAQARAADQAARESIRDDDDSAYTEAIRLLSAHVGQGESRLRLAATGPVNPSAVTAPAPSRSKMMLGKNKIYASYVGATCAFLIGDVRVPPEPVQMLAELYGAALSWYEHEQCALAVVDGRIVGIVRNVASLAAARPDHDDTDLDE